MRRTRKNKPIGTRLTIRTRLTIPSCDLILPPSHSITFNFICYKVLQIYPICYATLISSREIYFCFCCYRYIASHLPHPADILLLSAHTGIVSLFRYILQLTDPLFSCASSDTSSMSYHPYCKCMFL